MSSALTSSGTHQKISTAFSNIRVALDDVAHSPLSTRGGRESWELKPKCTLVIRSNVKASLARGTFRAQKEPSAASKPQEPLLDTAPASPSAASAPHLLHCRLTNLIRVLADALEEVFKIRHGEFLDLLTQGRDAVCHDLAETIVAHLRQVHVLQVLQGLQGRVVSGRKDRPLSAAAGRQDPSLLSHSLPEDSPLRPGFLCTAKIGRKSASLPAPPLLSQAAKQAGKEAEAPPGISSTCPYPASHSSEGGSVYLCIFSVTYRGTK